MMLEKLGIHSMAPCLTPCTKISSKWIRGLNLKAVMLKAREESKGSTLQERSVEKDFLKRTSFAQELMSEMYKWNLIKLKTSCTYNETITNRVKKNPTECKRIFAAIPLKEDSYPDYTKESKTNSQENK